MKSNIGKTMRIVLGVLIAAVGIIFKSWWGLVAIAPWLTAFTGLCPLYKLLGINTNKTHIKVN